ncbi:MAG TPA: argininosuccinate lyase [Planctomycetes bacterium]|nr:argininosuccinate lyase [Planctomycetota bacterium]
MSLWGGRFSKGLDPAFDSFNRSLPFDRRMWREDLEGSRAWARALEAAGVLKKTERTRIEKALRKLQKELEADPGALERSGSEDIHSFVEAALIRECGDLGKKLHTGRSRNDQVATDLRLWLRSRVLLLDGSLEELQRAFTRLALREAGTLLPGFTHLQKAQVLTVGHYALAYVEMLARDRERLAQASKRAERCPLGSGALAGTGFPIDRRALARDLGFDAPTRNSLDAVSDRDFVAELLFVASLSAAHLARFSEDWIFYASAEAGYLELGDEVTTGSSLMPQKKNPDSLELIRGKGGRILGKLCGFLATLRSLPLAYNKDLQEDKEALFETLDQWQACLEVSRLVVDSARFHRERLEESSRRGYLNATDLADYLVQEGVPFRQAHDLTGRLVRLGISRKKELQELSLEEMREVSSRIGPEVYDFLDPHRALARRSALGAANPRLVLREARRWAKALQIPSGGSREKQKNKKRSKG